MMCSDVLHIDSIELKKAGNTSLLDSCFGPRSLWVASSLGWLQCCHRRNRWRVRTRLALSVHSTWIGSCNIDLDPAICGGGRRPRSTVDGGRRQRSAKGRDQRRPKAGVGACRASRARTRAEAPIQVRKGPFDPPLCVSPLVCPSDAMLLPSSAIRHAMAPLRPAQVPVSYTHLTLPTIYSV